MAAAQIMRAPAFPLVVALALALTGCGSSAPSPQPSGSSGDNGAPWPTPEVAPFDPTLLGWRAVVDELDADSQELIGHWLYVGRLSDAKPAARISLVETTWSFKTFAQQIPITAGPAGGLVLYVADDGISSQVRVVGVDGAEDRMVAALDPVVLSSALAPDGSIAYVDLLDRTNGSEVGVFALSTDGSREIQQIMGPAEGIGAARVGGTVLAAVSRFERRLTASSDGRQVARLACGVARCQVDVFDVRTAALVSFQDPPTLLFYGMADGIIVGEFDCRDPSCPDFSRTDAVEVATQRRIRIGVDVGTTVATGGDGRLVLIGQQGAAEGLVEPEIRGTDLRTGATRILTTLDGAVLPQPDDRFGVEMPRGWQWIGSCDGPGVCPIALNLSTGERIVLAAVQFQAPIGGGHD